MNNSKQDGRQLSVVEIYQRDLHATERQSLKVLDGSLARWRVELKTTHPDPAACLQAARCLRKLDKYPEALTVLEEGIRSCDHSIVIYRRYVGLLEECNLIPEAISAGQEAARRFPYDLSAKLMEALILPVVYDKPDELDYYRRRYATGLQRLREEIRLDTAEGRRQALSVIETQPAPLISYQGRNDRELQEEYGDLIHTIMAANYPEWVRPLRMPESPSAGKLRIGYVSSRFRNLSATKYFLGWLREHNKEKFALYAYHTGRKVDPITEEVKRICQSFRHVPNSLENAARAILADDLHILVFLDVGLDPTMSQLAALRLAPTQCIAWDHPVTSGMPTIDYFLSSALAEPKNAQDHYSEELVLLPGVGVCYPKPVVPVLLLRKTRRSFQLREEAVVYLCCQEARKFLPDQDELFAEIASQVPNSQFVFLVQNTLVGSDLRRRLALAFSAWGLEASKHCVLLSELDRFSYWNLLLLGDVFLDAIGWSGGVSTFEAIACGLPIVTVPGTIMRSRQTSAILTQLGVTDAIARDKSGYVEIAVRLGLDRRRRKETSLRMVSHHSLLYSDQQSAGALEEFFERRVEERLRMQPRGAGPME